MDSKVPAVSVVMACYNEEVHLGRAIESLQAQTLTDWELILIDDGSSDGSVAVAERYAACDPRIRMIRCGINIGLPACLNIGIFLARADLIARADADDVNLPERLARQFVYMRDHFEIDVLGTGAYLLDAGGARRGKTLLPSNQEELVALAYRSPLFFHPSVMIRRRFFNLVGVYDVRAMRAQDRELWLRGLRHGAVYGNLSEYLIEYRTNDYRWTWRTIFRSYWAALMLTKRYDIRFGFLKATLSFVRLVLIKLGAYRANSMRGGDNLAIL